MRVGVAVLLLLAGAAMGWGAACLFQPEAPGAPLVDHDVKGASDDSSLRLRGRGTRRAESTTDEPPPGGAPVPPEEMDFVISQTGGIEFPALSAHRDRAWSALLTLYALSGRVEDLMRNVLDALAAGMDAGELVDVLRLLPVGMAAEAVDGLMWMCPDVDWPLDDVADVLVTAGRSDQAIALLEPALADGPHRSLIESLVKADPERAAPILARLARGGDWPADRLEQVGDALVAEGRAELAAPFYERGLAKEPLDRSLLSGLAQTSPQQALAHARRIADEHATDPELLQTLAKLELEVGDASAAFEAYQRSASQSLTKEALLGMLAADPERAFRATVALEGAAEDDELLGVLARMALASDRTSESLDVLRRAHNSDPSDHEWNQALAALDPRLAAEVLAASAQTYRGEDRDEVIGAYGNALLELGQPENAYERYREAYEMDPRDGEWQRGLARANPRAAVPLLEARRRDAGDDGDLLGALADAYAGTGRREDARRLYEAAVENGGGFEWYGRMALVDPEGARTRLEEATTSRPEDDKAWAALGDYHRLLGHKDAARAAYGRARALNPTDLRWEATWRALGN